MLIYRLPKMNTPDIPKVAGHDIQNEVQDFSLKKQTCPSANTSTTVAAGKSSGNKLDDTLSKLMKRKNCVSIHLLDFILIKLIE